MEIISTGVWHHRDILLSIILENLYHIPKIRRQISKGIKDARISGNK